MPRSYKICILKHFDNQSIGKKTLVFGNQREFEGMDKGPETQIYSSRDSVSLDDFERYTIEHEIEETVHGRVGSTTFQKYIRLGEIDAFKSASRNLLLLSGKKRDVLDFCRRYKDHPSFAFETTKITMNQLLQLLPSVKGVWFGFPNGQLSASALMGHNLEATPDFQHFKERGTISTLSFLLSVNGEVHPLMVTEDGTVVLQANYGTRSNELELVLEVKTKLLEKILVNDESADSKKTSQKQPT